MPCKFAGTTVCSAAVFIGFAAVERGGSCFGFGMTGGFLEAAAALPDVDDANDDDDDNERAEEGEGGGEEDWIAVLLLGAVKPVMMCLAVVLVVVVGKTSSLIGVSNSESFALSLEPARLLGSDSPLPALVVFLAVLLVFLVLLLLLLLDNDLGRVVRGGRGGPGTRVAVAGDTAAVPAIAVAATEAVSL